MALRPGKNNCHECVATNIFAAPARVLLSCSPANSLEVSGLQAFAFLELAPEPGAATPAKFGWCSTLAFSSDGHDTAMSLNPFANPFLSAGTSFVCHTY